jgi:LysW-gamma-L-lysine/LysW-L-ornithine aminotransferase
LVQGEGGVNIARKEYIKQVWELCTRNNILFIVDEVQTGFCRTGRMFACEHYDISPDILCLAKAIAGGLPMGAVLCADSVNVPVGKHGTTFGGNPLVCAAACAAIDYMVKENLAEQSKLKGDYFVSKFPNAELPKVREVRHLGLMIGIELKEKSQQYLVELMQRGVLALPAGPNVIRLLPPLTISYEDLDTVANEIAAVLR